MQCKHDKIRQKSKVKKSAKTIFGAGNPRNCLCPIEQQEALKSVVSKPKGHQTLL